VIYIYRNERFPIFLIAVFAKNEKANLSKKERNDLKKRADGILVLTERDKAMATAYEKLMNGLDEVEGYLSGDSKGHKVTVPGDVDIKAVRKRLGLTQMQFSVTFSLSLDNVKNWESHRRQPEAPARALLTVIENDPAAVIYALHPEAAKAAHYKSRKDSYARAKRALAAAAGA